MGLGSRLKKAMNPLRRVGRSSIGKTARKLHAMTDPLGSAIVDKASGQSGMGFKDRMKLSAGITQAQKAIQVENKLSTATVRETSHALGTVADAAGVNSHLPNLVERKAEKDAQSSTRKWTNAAVAAGAIYGGMQAYGAMSGAGAGTVAGEGMSLAEIGGASAALDANAIGYAGGIAAGTSYALPAFGGAAAGAGAASLGSYLSGAGKVAGAAASITAAGKNRAVIDGGDFVQGQGADTATAGALPSQSVVLGLALAAGAAFMLLKGKK